MVEETKTQRTPLWLKIVLSISLALNLMVAGLVAGVMARGGPVGVQVPGMGYAAPYVIALPRVDRRAVFRAVRGNPDLRDRRARRGDFQEMLTLLRTEPFDAVAAQVVLTRQGGAVAQVQAVAQGAWLDAVSGMAMADRAAYADELEEILDRGPRDKR